MIEGYATEEQQADAIKRWWKENGMALIFGVILGLGGLFGWRFYSDYKLGNQETSSQAYESVLAALDTKGLDARADVDAFIASESSNYQYLAGLTMANVAVQAEDYATAAEYLKPIAANGATVEMKAIAGIRLARVQAEQEQYDVAMATLAMIELEAYQGRISELRGDILLAQGNEDGAREAYEDAMLKGEATNQLLQMKLNDLTTN